MTTRVAVVGTGRMGAAMVGRLVDADFDVVVFNRTQERAHAVAERYGLPVAATAADAVASADVAVVSLADDAAAQQVYTDEHGLIAGAHPGLVVADTSTLAPTTVMTLAGKLAASDAALIDTPVSGSVTTVEAGELTAMAGGEPDALETAKPVLACFASRVVHLGPAGAGAAMKLAVNSVLHALNVALAEGLVLAERAGIDREIAYDVIASGAAGAPFVQYKRSAFLHPDDEPVAFSLELVAKDLALIDDLASELASPARQLQANRQIVEQAIANGLAHADMSAIADMLRGVDTP